MQRPDDARLAASDLLAVGGVRYHVDIRVDPGE